MNILIFCKKTKFQNIYHWADKYISTTNLIGNKNKKIIVPEDIMNASENRLMDYNASLLEKDILDTLLDKTTIDSLKNDYSIGQIRDIFGKKVIFEIKKILRSIEYAKVIKRKYKIESSIYIWPEDFNYQIYNYLYRKNLIPNNIKFTKISLVYNFLRNITKNIFFIVKSLFFLERSCLQRKSEESFSNNYKYIVHMDDGLIDWKLNSKGLMIDGKDIKKKDVLFINTEKNYPSWLKEYQKDNFAVLSLDRLPSLLSKGILLSIYLRFFRFRFTILKLFYRQIWASSEIFYLFKERFLWELFYNRFEIKKSISFMITRSIAESLVHERNKTETIFIYFSTTENILNNIDNPIVSHCHDYTHMYYDTLITNKISAKWFKTLQNTIKNIFTIGPLHSDIIVKTKKTKLSLIKNLKIDNFEKYIAFIDTPGGLYSILDINSYKCFISSLIKISKKYPKNCYLFKSKKKYTDLLKLNDSELNEMLRRISLAANIVDVNNLSLSVYQAIGISDFIVSGPKSSVIYESLHAHQPTICYDTSQLLSKTAVYNNISKCNAFDESELLELHEYWSSKNINRDTKIYFEHVDHILDFPGCSGDNFQSLRNSIVRNLS